MSIKTRREQRLAFWADMVHAVLDSMQLEKWQLASEVLVSLAILALAWQSTTIVRTVSVIVVGVINTVSVADLVRAWRDVQATNREEFTDD